MTYRPAQPNEVFVSASGTPPADSILNDPNNWTLIAKRGKLDRAPVKVLSATWDAGVKSATLTFDPAGLGGADPASVGFIALLPSLGLSSSTPKPPDTGLQAAKGKDDADIYLFGSFLAGVSTKPLYTFDLKFGWAQEFGQKGWNWGVKASMITNAGASAPVDRTTIDPDSIKGSLLFTRIQPLSFGRVNGIQYELSPLAGEFARKFPSSNFVPSAFAQIGMKPWQVAPRHWIAFYPRLGFEGGANLNRPSVLFKQPVDLTGYRGIARLYYAALGEWYFVNKSPSGDDVYRFTLDAKAQARTPLTQEPYVTAEYVNGQRAQITRLRKNTRPEFEVAAGYAFTPLFGIRVQYLYGSLPPLFEFTDHQVTVGLTFKAKQP